MKRTIDQTKPADQDIDTLLRDFFQSEMPHPWPAFQPPRRQSLPYRPREKRPFALTSRWALAASVAVLLISGWLLSGSLGRMAPGRTVGPEMPQGGDADGTKGRHHPFERLQPIEKDKPALDLQPE